MIWIWYELQSRDMTERAVHTLIITGMFILIEFIQLVVVIAPWF